MDDDEYISQNEVEEKKKPRRVNFLDITYIRFFDRDEDFEMPTDNKPSIEASALHSNALNVINTPLTMDQQDTPDRVREFFGPVPLWHIAPRSTTQSLATETTEDSAGNSMTLTQGFQSDWQPVSTDCTRRSDEIGGDSRKLFAGQTHITRCTQQCDTL
eukprot:Gb_34187 [translate_table: standard]